MNVIEMIEAFRNRYRERHQFLRTLKEGGVGLVGWVYTYVPEEIIEAAGLHPFRITGGEGVTARADAYLYTNSCSFVRSCLEEGLSGELPPLDGLVTCNTCDHIRRLYDVWARYLSPPFHRQLCLPCHFGPSALDYFHQELVRFKEALEGHFGVEITDEALRESICLYNRMVPKNCVFRDKVHGTTSGLEITQAAVEKMITPADVVPVRCSVAHY